MCRIKRWNRRWGCNEDTDGEQEYGMYNENCYHANQWLHLLLLRMRHGSVGSMSARCKAGPSSNPDSAPQGGVCH